MAAKPQFVVVTQDVIERELAAKVTPRRVTEADQRRDREVRVFCRKCHDWFIYHPEDVQERSEVKKGFNGEYKSYDRFVLCVCGAEKVLSISQESTAEREAAAMEIQKRRNAERTCSDCGTRPANHYCSVCRSFFCCRNGCGAGERGHHPTTEVPPEMIPEGLR